MGDDETGGTDRRMQKCKVGHLAGNQLRGDAGQACNGFAVDDSRRQGKSRSESPVLAGDLRYSGRHDKRPPPQQKRGQLE